MRAPRILCVASAIDLNHRAGCTPAWWQLWKGLYEEGVDLVVAPYRGRPVETPWWRSARNPTYYEGESFVKAREFTARFRADKMHRRVEENPEESLTDRMTRQTIWKWVTPRWRRYLEDLIEEEKPDALIIFSVPMAHLRGVPTLLRERFGIPVVFYDGDVPMSLPEYGGADTGFNPYHGADPGEYDMIISNSLGGIDTLLELGAQRAEAIFWGADPEYFAPQAVEKEMDVFFYGHSDKFRRDWTTAMIGEPSRALEGVDFAIGGYDYAGDTGTAREIGVVPFSQFSRAISGARVNLCITRRPHASLDSSSSCRPFELAAAGAAIVSNPVVGLERWFEPGSELIVVNDAEEATAAYRALLDDPGQAEELGRRARERVLDEHTYRHRARQLLELVNLGAAAGVG